MRKTFLVGAVALCAAAACDTPRDGAYGNIEFTPTQCGQPADGCDFADSIGVGGSISVTLDGIDGFSTAGVDLVSDDPDLLAVEPTEDIGAEPAWQLTALAPGVARLVAVQGGETVDLLEVPIQAVETLTMVPFVGNVVGGDPEGDYDQAFTINADESASWFIRPTVTGGDTTMGRFSFETVLDQGAPDILQYEDSNSDRPGGYLYVTPAAGDYPIEFQLTIDPDVYVYAIIHAI